MEADLINPVIVQTCGEHDDVSSGIVASDNIAIEHFYTFFTSRFFIAKSSF
jgi:hypothetical protein